MKYLEKQFPQDYPQDEEEKKKQMPKPPTDEEMAAKKKKDMEDYSKQVLENATEYNAKLAQEAKDKEDAEKNLADQNLDMVEEALVQLDPKVNLAQTSNNLFLTNLNKLGINLSEILPVESPAESVPEDPTLT